MIAPTLTQGALDVAWERNRQISQKGYNAERDQQNIHLELVSAALCFADVYMDQANGTPIPDDEPAPIEWPVTWDEDRWKVLPKRDNLVRAAALLIAEIDRLDAQKAGHE